VVARETLHPGRQGGEKEGRREEWRGREGGRDRRNSKVEGGGGKGKKEEGNCHLQ